MINAVRTLGIIKSSEPDVIAAFQRIAALVTGPAVFSAVWALGEIGPAAASAIRELRKLTSESPEEMIRIRAAEALKKIDRDGEQ